jgi:alcohol dehydrogenase
MVLEAPRRLVRRELAVPEVGADDAILRIEACGLCGTDHEQYTGVLPSGLPFVPGHEAVGSIEAIGSRAAKRWGVCAGDRVAVEVFQSCHTCESCEIGEYRRCSRHGLADMYGFIPVDRPPGLWGGYATHQYLSPDSKVLRVPSELDPVVATLFNPLGAGIRWGSSLPGTGDGDVVAVLGAGVRGLSALVGAREAGASFVMVTGRGPNDAPRLEAARSFGADLIVDVTLEDPVSALKGAAGRLADVVVDVTAKAPAAFAQAVDLARAGGTVVVAGTRGVPSTPGVSSTPGFRPDDLVYKELRILGALGVDTAAYEAALALLASGRYPFESLARRVAPLEEVGVLLDAMSGDGGVVPPIHAVVVP